MYATSQGMLSQQVPDFYEFTRDGITDIWIMVGLCEIACGMMYWSCMKSHGIIYALTSTSHPKYSTWRRGP